MRGQGPVGGRGATVFPSSSPRDAFARVMGVALHRVAAILGIVFSELYMLFDRGSRARAQDVAQKFGSVALVAAQKSNSTLLKRLVSFSK